MSHYTLNPNELALAQDKGLIKANLFNMEQLAWEGFGIVTGDNDVWSCEDEVPSPSSSRLLYILLCSSSRLL